MMESKRLFNRAESAEAIELLLQSVPADEKDWDDKAARIFTIGMAYDQRFKTFGDADAIHKAITHFYRALEMLEVVGDVHQQGQQLRVTVGKNLADALSQRSALFQDFHDLENAIAVLKQVKDWVKNPGPGHTVPSHYTEIDLDHSLGQLLVA